MTSTAVLREFEAGRSAVRGTVSETQAHAQRLLDAWVAGDRQRLDYELSRSRTMNFGTENEDGRKELLLSLVLQMMDEPDLFAPRSTKLHLGVWLDLLAHLAEPE